VNSDEFISTLLAAMPVPPDDIYCLDSESLCEDGESVLRLYVYRSGRTAGLLNRVGEEPTTPIQYLD